MATRSRIAKLNDDGTFTSIYAHWDGYPSYRGPILLNHYLDPEKVDALLAHGDVSSLAENIGTKHDFESREHRDQCTFYMRDRGETGCDAVVSADYDALCALTQDCGGEYLYVFMGGAWFCAEGGIAFFGAPAAAAPAELDLVEAFLQPNTGE